jgi:hypothetical protein
MFAHHGLLGRREDAVGYAVKLQVLACSYHFK